jgi:hypothetical protein
MHIRTSRAAVAADTHFHPQNRRPSQRPTTTLWATRPLALRAGRAIGVRLVGGLDVEVAVVPRGEDRLRWLPASVVLTEKQAEVWVRSTQFRRPA